MTWNCCSPLLIPTDLLSHDIDPSTQSSLLPQSLSRIVTKHAPWQVYEDDRYIYLLMEACMGGELFDLIIKRGHFSEQDAANVARVVLEVQAVCAVACCQTQPSVSGWRLLPRELRHEVEHGHPAR